jgi:signal transduction histidine kinase
LDQESATAVFRIFQEALTNVLRHAQATSVEITMTKSAAEFSLCIQDNGRGITERDQTGPQALGLLGMRERAHLIGGRVEISGRAGLGTTVMIHVPLARNTTTEQLQTALNGHAAD